ncbi:hypothetical protein BP5796_00199 [Coleophoma crateriformis]|uniref:Uncharacterized protein n=1 Tax=Coleophoma crateriformis TaxID=565419 RepID=A0A3D8T7B3_9HELO|nr:hypothetical protein BP5796_00199 [Coleophoma crateriformis]
MNSSQFKDDFDDLWAVTGPRIITLKKQGPEFHGIKNAIDAEFKFGENKYTARRPQMAGWSLIDYYALCLQLLVFEPDNNSPEEHDPRRVSRESGHQVRGGPPDDDELVNEGNTLEDTLIGSLGEPSGTNTGNEGGISPLVEEELVNDTAYRFKNGNGGNLDTIRVATNKEIKKLVKKLSIDTKLSNEQESKILACQKVIGLNTMISKYKKRDRTENRLAMINDSSRLSKMYILFGTTLASNIELDKAIADFRSELDAWNEQIAAHEEENLGTTPPPIPD